MFSPEKKILEISLNEKPLIPDESKVTMTVAPILLRDINNKIACEKGSVVAMGNFDGFHQGHRRIMDTLLDIARRDHLVSVIITFIPNPKIHFNRGASLITSHEQKKEFLDRLGVGHILFLHFPEILDMSGEAFVRDVLVSKLKMKHIVMGENFRFGKNRGSDINSLQHMGERWGFNFTVVPSLVLDGIRISSSLIREKLEAGGIEESNRMLGRRYYIDGVVVHGERIGHKLGFPTINIDTANTLLPQGVFGTLVEISGEIYSSVTYIGTKPTFAGQEKKVETHILDFSGEIYGRRVRLFFLNKIRGDMKFTSTAALVEQIKKDIDRIKR